MSFEVDFLSRDSTFGVAATLGGAARRDCIFVEHDPAQPGFRGLYAARVMAFMSFTASGITYPCALVTWFSAIGDEPCPDVGMWMVEPDLDANGEREMSIIHWTPFYVLRTYFPYMATILFLVILNIPALLTFLLLSTLINMQTTIRTR
ncbi:hypothetical protein B0H13DRAFT_2320952 [Mycena leptocephala]|nr:hypothetical protein B0H13DRAFT_2320952 [Mycena leptocephala]